MGVVAAVLALARMPIGRTVAVAGVQPVSGVVENLPVRLRELGFLDGERVTVLASGFAGGPLAVRVGGTTFALRSAEAESVLVHLPPA